MKGLHLLAAVFCFISAAQLQAGFVTSTLGNSSPGFSAGDIIDVFDLMSAQSGQPAPFNAGIGSDPIENFSANWTHIYGPVSQIVAATITFGIYDNDAATTGDQLKSFSVAGTDLFSSLNPLFEAASPGNGQNSQYNVYTLSLPAALFGALESGSAIVTLALKGPTFSPGLPGITPDILTEFNGAGLIFSRIDIEFRPIPEPSSLALLASGGLALFGISRVRKRLQHRARID